MVRWLLSMHREAPLADRLVLRPQCAPFSQSATVGAPPKCYGRVHPPGTEACTCRWQRGRWRPRLTCVLACLQKQVLVAVYRSGRGQVLAPAPYIVTNPLLDMQLDISDRFLLLGQPGVELGLE